MCSCNDFDIVYYKDGVVIRKCKSCKKFEVMTEYWAGMDRLANIINEMEKENGKEEK